MATSLTRNLKLRINSNLTADAKYNLERLDLLGSTFLTDSTDTLNIRSRTDILIEPESPDLDGSGTGGTVNIGNASHNIDNLFIYALNTNLSKSLGLLDQATSGTKYLRLKYKTDLNGSLDTVADRNLSVDLEGADRSLVLGGSLSILSGDLTLNLTGTTSLILPLTGTLSTLSNVETLTNKTIDADSNNISNIDNNEIKANAGIVYSKLTLTDNIVNSDINTAAAIAYSKLNLSNSILNSDINVSAGIAYSKLSLSNSILNADISTSAAIQYSKLLLSNSIVDSDINSAAAVAYSKLALTGSIQYADLVPGIVNSLLPTQTGNSGKFLTTNGTSISWATASGGGGGSGDVLSYSGDWLFTDGTTKILTHNLASTDVDVTIIALDTNEIIGVNSILVTDNNTLTLSSSEAPATSWRVVVQAKP